MASSTSNNPIKSFISLLSKFFDSRLLFLKYQRKFNSIFFHREFYRILYVQAVTAFRHIPTLTAHLLLFTPLFITLTFPHPLLADIVTDGSVGPAQALSGPDVTIPESLGTVSGQNLLHSFQKFSIGENESATFTGSDTISNVISRVTGGDISTIDGKLISKVGNADFFFINPSGVVFGPHASVDVPAAFHVSTADALHFSDGTVLNCTSPDPSTLTQAAPEAFGFLGTQRANIEINGSVLAFESESSVSITAGDIAIQPFDDASAEITATSGNVSLSATGNTQIRIPTLNESTTTLPLTKANGMITVESSIIDVSGNGGGNMAIEGGRLKIDNATITSDNTGNKHAQNKIDISLNDTLEIVNQGYISNGTLNNGNAGEVIVKSKSITINGQGNDAGIYSQAEKEKFYGNAGKIKLNVIDEVKLLNGGRISSDSYSNGDSGHINISSSKIKLDGNGFYTGISTDAADSDSVGTAGKIVIDVDDSIELFDNAEISSSTWSQGDAGTVDISANNIKIDGEGDYAGVYSMAIEKNNEGHGGNITIITNKSLDMTNGSEISTSTWSQGDAGNILISAKTINIDGQGSYTGIYSQANDENSKGNAGNIELSVEEELSLIEGGRLSCDSFSFGNAGTITIKTSDLTLDGNGAYTGISCDSINNDSNSNAGLLSINVNDLFEVLDGSEISCNSESYGNAGEISIAAGLINIDGNGYETGIYSQTKGINANGHSGNIELNILESFNLTNAGYVSSESFSNGGAGHISISASNLTINGFSNRSGISSETHNVDGNGNAGDIAVTVCDQINITNKGIISSSTHSKGDAGNIHVTAEHLTIDGEGSNTSIKNEAIEDSEGNSGIIEINVGKKMEMLNGAQISSKTKSIGNAGEIILSAEEFILDGQNSYVETTIDSSTSTEESNGNAGNIEIKVNSTFSVLDGAQIFASTNSQGNGGNINITAGNILIDDKNSDSQTKISSSSYSTQTTGNAGTIEILSDGALEILNGASIVSSTFSYGDAGSIIVDANDILIDDQGSTSWSGIASSAEKNSKGNAGEIKISTSGQLQIINGGQISCTTLSDGDAGNIKIQSNKIFINNQNSDSDTGIFCSAARNSFGNAGTINITVNDLLEIVNGGQIYNGTYSTGNAGSITISANDILINKQASKKLTGISNSAERNSEGNAGTIDITVNDLLQIINGGQIISSTFSKGNAGNVTVNAGDAIINDQRSKTLTGIASSAESESEGNAGNVTVNANHLLQLLNGGQIISVTFSKGDAGNVTVHAGEAIIDDQGSDSWTTIASTAEADSQGNGGSVTLTIDSLLQLINGAGISTSTFSEGDAGNIFINADEIVLDGYQSDISSASENDLGKDAGTIEIHCNKMIKILNGAQISTSTSSKGNAGKIVIKAGEILIDDQDYYGATGIESSANYGSSGHAGSVEILAEELIQLKNGAHIFSETWSTGNAGTINIKAAKMILDGKNGNVMTQISTTANYDSTGNAGNIEISIDDLIQILNDARVASLTFSKGNGGKISIRSGELIIDGENSAILFPSIQSSAESFSEGNAGIVEVSIDGLMTIANGGHISSSTWSDGNAGNVSVESNNIRVDGNGVSSGIFSNAYNTSKGNAGTITIHTRDTIDLENGAEISSSTWSEGDAGNVSVESNNIRVDGHGVLTGIFSNANDLSKGNAGTITIHTRDTIDLENGAEISSSTWSEGNAGSITITADNLNIDGNGYYSGIYSNALMNSKGNAGTIHIKKIDNLLELNDASIASSTWGEGDAGNVIINASKVILDSSFIHSAASTESSGHVGSLSIDSDSITLLDSSKFSIGAFQTLPIEKLDQDIKKEIFIHARNLHLDQSSQISSESTNNAPASDIGIYSDKLIVKGDSKITTQAEDADGGDITVQSDTIFLNDGQITTSVLDTNGDGGDITIRGTTNDDPADHLIMKHGFIQANTAAKDAKGGDILLDVKGIIFDKSGEGLSIDSPDRKDFDKNPRLSVIQAAAPEGTRGEIHLNEDSLLDISGSIADISTRITEPLPIFTDPCRMVENVNASAILQEIKADPLMWTEAPSTIPFTTERLKTIEIMQ